MTYDLGEYWSKSRERDVQIHSTADISPRATIGTGTVVWHQAQVREGARLGRNCIVGKGVYIDCDVRIGDNVKIQNYASVYRGATIEDGVFIGPYVCLTNDKLPRAVNPDGSPKGASDWEVSPILVREGASISAGAIVLPGVTVGRWAMVGAGAVVTRDVPDYGLVWGNPARPQGYVCPCGQRLKMVKQQGGKLLACCTSCSFELAFYTSLAGWEAVKGRQWRVERG